MLKREIRKRLADCLENLKRKGTIPEDLSIEPIVETPREKSLGDYSTNLPFFLGRRLKKPLSEIGNMIKESLEGEDLFDEVEVSDKGFVNFRLKDDYLRGLLGSLLRKGIKSYYPDLGMGRRVLVEFVSSNPTGPLHIGHGRCAAFGDVLCTILEKTGFDVTREYYINDYGRQIQTLGESVYLRLKELEGEKIEYPNGLYKGEYVKEIAREVLERGISLPKEKSECVNFLANYASQRIMDEIKEDLERFGVRFDSFRKESDLYASGMVDESLSLLKEKGFLYEKDGAIWFKTSSLERDEDRVLVKSSGEKTYFASDIAYHREKYLRGFDLIINIWGADHHGYVPRLKAALEAMDLDKNKLKVILIQFVTLIRDGKPIGMSTREATYTTLRELIDEVGKDASRFIFLTRKNDAHLEFDLNLAKSQSSENPVYYVQYAHARIESIFRNAVSAGYDLGFLEKGDIEQTELRFLSEEDEIGLIKEVVRFFDVIEAASIHMEPHRVTYYLIDLAQRFHTYYNTTRVLETDDNLRRARLVLVKVIKDTIKEGLSILGVSAPERM